jgi:mannose-6-phosphate isomerase-like protein (cupin superfamily)
MEPKIIKASSLTEAETPERCSIAENYSCTEVSLARATVKPGVTTRAHHLKGVDEIYLIVSGKGKVELGNSKSAWVGAGDTIVFPAGASEKITNVGKADLVFYCICTPRFTAECYCNEETAP